MSYQNDFYQWTQQQADLLRQGAFSELDVENLIEEIETTGRSQRDAIGSHLVIILMHMLKWRYQPERRSTTSWRDSVVNGRIQIDDLLENNPSLNSKVQSLIERGYPKARRYASRETDLPLATFPEECPFTIEQITGDYWPE